jgi:hypothetical protein
LFFSAELLPSWSTSRKATNIVMALQQEPDMHIYSAYVRANGQVIQTQVCANNVSDAINLLKGMYGSDNLVHLPQLV